MGEIGVFKWAERRRRSCRFFVPPSLRASSASASASASQLRLRLIGRERASGKSRGKRATERNLNRRAVSGELGTMRILQRSPRRFNTRKNLRISLISAPSREASLPFASNQVQR